MRAAVNEEIKRLLTANDGKVGLVASLLGMDRTALSRRLNRNPRLAPWWTKYKKALRLKHARARQQRWRDRKALREQGLIE